MTFLAPGWLALGLAAASVMVLLHLITRDRPPRAPLPTARFVPPRVERAMTRAVRPADPLLLVLRVLALVLAAAAFARPVLEPERRSIARVVALDLSRAVADPAAARDSALGLLLAGDALVLFDSSARVVVETARDTVAALALDAATRRPRGALSPALIAAQRAAMPLRELADSIELVIVSALAREELDAATEAIRALWPGRVRLVLVRRADGARHVAPEVRASASDPLGAAAALLGAPLASEGAGGPVLDRSNRRARDVARDGSPAEDPAPVLARSRVIRDSPSAADSSAARTGAALVIWPREPAMLGWPERATPDTVGAVIATDVVLVAPFVRTRAAPAGGAVPQSAIVARWVDGEPAAIERPLGAGCVREVGIPLDPVGDLALRPELRALLLALSAPCGGERRLDALEAPVLATLAGDGGLLDARRLEAQRDSPTPAVPWLLGAALLLGVLEPLARRLGRRG